jgi:hypothetical protein
MFALTVVILLCTGAGFWYSHSVEKPVDCVGDAEWAIDNNHFSGTVSMRMSDHEGLATITGKLHGKKISNINRSIYFNYNQQRYARILHSKQVIKTFSDTADEDDIKDILPGFYYQIGGVMSLVTEEYKGAWILATSNVPSLYCRKR